ncbi:MAG: substrate-binding domain-containing protein [Cardiobacteriaceae bacterium]|nr:substrate-binding domain-containing protein [Cardiobacteriaceae bacterium]
MNRKQSFVVKCLGLTGVILGLSGCFDQGAKEEATESQDTVTLGVSIARNDDNSPFLQAYYQGFVENAKQNPKISLLIDDAKNDQDNQFAQLDEMIKKGAKGLAINLVERKRGGESIARYCGKVHLVYISNPGEREMASCEKTYRVMTDDFSGGVVLGNEILKQWKSNPSWDKNGDQSIQMAIIASRRTDSGLGDNIEWALETMTRSPDVAVNIEQVLEGHALYQTSVARNVAEEWLQDPRFPEVELVIAGSDSMAFGLLEVFKANNVNLPIFSFDALPEAKRAMERGEIRYTVEANVGEETRVALLVLENLSRGLPPEHQLRYPIKDREIRVPVKGAR